MSSHNEEQDDVEFSLWWANTGSGIPSKWEHDQEEHAERMAGLAWKAALAATIPVQLFDSFSVMNKANELRAKDCENVPDDRKRAPIKPMDCCDILDAIVALLKEEKEGLKNAEKNN